MLSLTLMLVLAAGTFTDAADEPKKCCSSRQYTTKAVQLGARVEYGMGVPTEGYQEVVYDYDAKRLYSTTSEYDIRSNTTSTIKVLQDFEAKKQYITLEDDTCYYQEITTLMPPPCVSENATFMGQGKVGLGGNSMDVLSWQVRDGALLTTMAFDAKSCVPVVYSMFGNIYGMDQVMTYFYYDFQPSITDSSKLTIPEDCKPQPTANAPWRAEL